jgi:hypothetical protein
VVTGGGVGGGIDFLGGGGVGGPRDLVAGFGGGKLWRRC